MCCGKGSWGRGGSCICCCRAACCWAENEKSTRDTDGYEHKLYRNGGPSPGQTNVGNLSQDSFSEMTSPQLQPDTPVTDPPTYDDGNMSSGAPQPTGYSEVEGLGIYSAWKWGSLEDAKAYSDLLKQQASDASTGAQNTIDAANEQEQKMADIAGEIGSAVYGDRPVILWWEVFWGLSAHGYFSGMKRDDTEATQRWSKDGTGDGMGNRQKQTWWELDSTVEEDTDKRHDYKWTLDARKITHMTFLTMPYKFGLNNHGLGEWMFAAKDDNGGNRMFDGRGFGALSRAECVYISPTSRSQWPNVFNPYWRPRLAPISYEITNLLEKIPIFEDVGTETEGFSAMFNTFLRNIFPH